MTVGVEFMAIVTLRLPRLVCLKLDRYAYAIACRQNRYGRTLMKCSYHQISNTEARDRRVSA